MQLEKDQRIRMKNKCSLFRRIERSKMKDYRNKIIVLVAVLTVALFLTTNAWALLIDFRDSSWKGADYQHSFSRDILHDGISTQVTVSAWGDNDTSDPTELYLGWWGIDKGSSPDGLGIYGGEEDEIDRNEYMQVDIEGGMFVSGVYLTDFYRTYNNSNDGDPFTREHAHVQLFNGKTALNTFEFVATGIYPDDDDLARNNGEFSGDFEDKYFVTSLRFSAPYKTTIDFNNNEFSLGGIEGEFAPVPEPSTMMLMGIGLLALVGFMKRKADQPA